MQAPGQGPGPGLGGGVEIRGSGRPHRLALPASVWHGEASVHGRLRS